jgi:hypothetical protein
VGGTNWREIHHKGGFIIQSVGGTVLEWRIASTQGGRLRGREGHVSRKHQSVHQSVGGTNLEHQSVGGTNLEWRIASTQGGRLHGRDGHASVKHHDGR